MHPSSHLLFLKPPVQDSTLATAPQATAYMRSCHSCALFIVFRVASASIVHTARACRVRFTYMFGVCRCVRLTWLLLLYATLAACDAPMPPPAEPSTPAATPQYTAPEVCVCAYACVRACVCVHACLCINECAWGVRVCSTYTVMPLSHSGPLQFRVCGLFCESG